MFNHKLPQTEFPMQTLRKKTSPCKCEFHFEITSYCPHTTHCCYTTSQKRAMYPASLITSILYLITAFCMFSYHSTSCIPDRRYFRYIAPLLVNKCSARIRHLRIGSTLHSPLYLHNIWLESLLSINTFAWKAFAPVSLNRLNIPTKKSTWPYWSLSHFRPVDCAHI